MKHKFKPLSKAEFETYVIDAKDYLDFINEMNKRRMIILRISPSYVATCISNHFVIYTMSKESE